MNWLRNAARRFFGRAELERELDEELASYLEMSAARHRAEGASSEEAQRLALRDLGGTEQTKERVRDVWAGAWLEVIVRDLRIGMRSLIRSPLFSIVAILTLSVGIGANSAIFSVVHSVLIEPLPYEDPERLALVWARFENAGQYRNPFSAHELDDLRQRTNSFEAFAGVWAGTVALTGEGDPEQLRAGYVTANFFETLGVSPAHGRSFEETEQGQGSPSAVILGNEVWQRRYAGDPGILGRTVELDGLQVAVVGVMPADFELRFPSGSGVPSGIQAWIPFAWRTADMRRDMSFIRTLARVRQGVSFEAAGMDLEQLREALHSEYGRYREIGFAFDLQPFQSDSVREIRPAILALFGGVTCVLLIVCVNVASLQLSRWSSRRREISVRRALGAGRVNILRQLLLESLMLAGAGGVLGLLVARLGMRALVQIRPPHLEHLDSVSLGGPVVLFTAGISLLSALLFGLAPMMVPAAGGPVIRGKDRIGASRTSEFLRRALVVSQFGLGLVLLIGTGLMTRTLLATFASDPGFSSTGVLTFQVSLPRSRYPTDIERADFAERLRLDLVKLPAVESVGATSHLPLDNYSNWYGFMWLDGASDAEKTALLADQRAVTPGLFEALGSRLVSGRFIDRTDRADARDVVVIDDLLANQLWPGQSAVGRSLNLERYENGRFPPRHVEVIGVVKHLKSHQLTNALRGQAYLPHAQSGRPVLSFALRTSVEPLALAAEVRQRVAKLDPDLPVAKLLPMDAYVDHASAPARFTTTVVAVFGLVALFLASLGVYGLLAHTVIQRRKEIGLRLAIGARPVQILARVLGDGLRSAAVGAAIGVVGALLLARVQTNLLYGVTPTDPLTYVAMSAILLVVAVLASLIPASQAARIDPIKSLRSE